MIDDLRKDLKEIADPKRAKILQRFFKTGKGEYGYGDVFLGVTVPQSRKIAQKYKDLPGSEITQLLRSKIHEERLVAILLLVHNFQLGNNQKKKEIYDFYLKHTKYINNWDLVDLSADKIIGEYLLDQDRDVLRNLAKSENLWERRIAIIATFQFIRKPCKLNSKVSFQTPLIKKEKSVEWTFKIARILLNDKHDLIQKAVGWMLREAGKQISQNLEEEFLKKYYKMMPRTMLRYAIERFDERTRKKYLRGEI